MDWIFRAIVFSIVVFSGCIDEAVAVLAGTLAKCDVEGSIDVPMVADNPCIRCFCRNSMVVCDVEKCGPLDCSLEDIINPPGECCPKCKHGKMCKMEDITYAHGQTWRHGCSQCECVNGENVCRVVPCEKKQIVCLQNFELKTPAGECCPRCVERESVCTVFGDPHYRTYDGKMFDFQGNCKYTLTKLCSDEAAFNIRVRNHVRLYENYAWTKMAAVQLNKTRIFLLQRMLVRVERKTVDLPYEHDGFNITIEDMSIVVRASNGIKIVWDGDSYLEVTVPAKLKTKLCGLCGNYNGDPSDDFIGKNGKRVHDSKEFGDQWRVGGKCLKPNRSNKPSPCLNPSVFSHKMLAHQECSFLFTPAFAKCREVLPVRPYYKACVTDVCDCPSNMQCSCEALIAYTKACARFNIVAEWKTPHFCGTPKCIYGSKYEKCMSACLRTCENPTADRNCNRPCVPGCECAPGLVLHKNRCVKFSRCKRLLQKRT
ncbi:BMP-binding endothelial regulator protein-like [Tubulanus polymorphus]|uniref:BMP-binding endothelial regulator protein-like n=1 Tax=Tubulanus polymorphus TaxID=672921 RepID=UPI003DA5859E